MSWDVAIFNTGGKWAPTLEDLDPSDFLPLGPAEEVRKQISASFAAVDWSDPTRGIYDGDEFSIEFNVGSGNPIADMMLHVRGGGDAIAAIARLAKPLGWSALDCSTLEFLDLENPSQAGWEGFQAFRDKIIEESRDEEVE